MVETDSDYDPAHSIHDAAHAGDVESITRQLEVNPERVRELGPSNMQPLHFAANAEIAEALIRFGAAVNARTTRGETPLHFAARNGHPDAAEVLVRHGADLHAVDDWGDTPLYLASHCPPPGTHEVARFLLDSGAELDLASALALGMLDDARRFLEDPDAVRNALHPYLLPRLAVWVIYQAIARAVGETKYALMYRRGKYKLDMDAIADVIAGNIDILEKILAQGVPMSYWSFEALMMAVELPLTAVAETLLKTGVGSPEWANCDYGRLARCVERSACKGPMRDLLVEFGMIFNG